MKRPIEEYRQEAYCLIADWVEAGFPITISVDSQPADKEHEPWPLLVNRIAPQSAKFQGASGSSFTVFPEVHFWFEDGSLGIARGRPIEYKAHDESSRYNASRSACGS